MHNLGRMNILVGPVHFGDVHQTFNAVFDFNEATVISNVGDLAEQARTDRITARDINPWIFTELFETQRYTVALTVKLEHLHINLIADIDDFGRMLDALPRHVGDVQQTIDATQINERAIIGKVFNSTPDGLAFFKVFKQGLAHGTAFAFNHGTP